MQTLKYGWTQRNNIITSVVPQMKRPSRRWVTTLRANTHCYYYLTAQEKMWVIIFEIRIEMPLSFWYLITRQVYTLPSLYLNLRFQLRPLGHHSRIYLPLELYKKNISGFWVPFLMLRIHQLDVYLKCFKWLLLPWYKLESNLNQVISKLLCYCGSLKKYYMKIWVEIHQV